MLIRLALRNLARKPRRTVAILLTVGMGTGSLFLLHGFNFGVMSQYRDNTVHARYGHGQIYTKGYRDTVFEKPWEYWIRNWEELSRNLPRRPEVEQLFPRASFAALVTNGDITLSGRGEGIDGVEESRFFDRLNIEEGVTLSDQPDGVLLGKGLATALKVGPGDTVTVHVNAISGGINQGNFTVTGIFHTGTKEFDDTAFRIPLEHAQRLLDTKGVETVALGLREVEDWNAVARIVETAYPELEAIPFAVLDKVYYQHAVDWLAAQFRVVQLIILTVVVLGIFNTVSTGVLERKQEIGNLRANGESVGDILRLLSYEGITLGVLGAVSGIGAAWLLNSVALTNGILMPPAPGITRQFHVLIELQPGMAATTFIMGTASAIAATLLAAIKVANMPIAKALRSE